MKYTVTLCPNTPEVIQAINGMKDNSRFSYKRRGRGYRHARWSGDVQYHQELPLALAERFTLYAVAKRKPGQSPYGPPYYNYTRCQFVGIEPSGKPRLKLLNH